MKREKERKKENPKSKKLILQMSYFTRLSDCFLLSVGH